MLIGIDARTLGRKKMCGVSRVTANVINAICSFDTRNNYIIFTDSTAHGLKLGSNAKVMVVPCSKFNPLHDIYFSQIIKSSGIQLFHSLNSWLPWRLPAKLKRIVTIYDIFLISDPKFFIKYWPLHRFIQFYFKQLISSTVKTADKIIAISEFSRSELINYFPCAQNKTDVAYIASGLINSKVKSKFNKNDNQEMYLLYVGNCRSYKNTEILIKGFEIFVKKNVSSKLNLIITGNDDYNKLKSLAVKLSISSRVIIKRKPSDEELISLYRHAVAFILPSKYEGFGIPVLEAMSFDIPVIISDAAALKEVAGDAAIVFDKNKPSELSLAIEKVLSNDILRNTMIMKGRERIKNFSWEQNAKEIVAIYDSVSKSV